MIWRSRNESVLVLRLTLPVSGSDLRSRKKTFRIGGTVDQQVLRLFPIFFPAERQVKSDVASHSAIHFDDFAGCDLELFRNIVDMFGREIDFLGRRNSAF